MVASVGHVRDLPKSKIGIDIDNDFEPEYIAIRGKGDLIKELRKEHNHSQEYLIEKVRLSINCYETGTKVPTLMSIYKICEFYKISISEFFAPINYPTPDK